MKKFFFERKINLNYFRSLDLIIIKERFFKRFKFLSCLITHTISLFESNKNKL